MSTRAVGSAVVVGVGATAVMDLGGEAIRRTTGAEPLDPALLGRWLSHMRGGRLAHPSIGEAAPMPAEREVGLAAHYGIGIAFAAALIAWRPQWIDRPTIAPAMAVGLGSTLAPWSVMQPAFGMGVAGAKTPNPTVVRFRSARAHAIYGLGLYLAGRALRRVSG